MEDKSFREFCLLVSEKEALHNNFEYEGFHLKWVKNIVAVLQKAKSSVYKKLFLEGSDIQKNVNEGGFKIWEGELDGVKFFIEKFKDSGLEKYNVCEMGCGSGLIGLFFLLKGANVLFQDYNEEVLLYHTFINTLINDSSHTPGLLNRAQFINGAWKDLKEDYWLSDRRFRFTRDKNSNYFTEKIDKQLKDKFDIIAASEILYEKENYASIVEFLQNGLKEGGLCFIISKKYYFGNEGNIYDFIEFLKKESRLRLKEEIELKDKSGGSIRVILVIQAL